jgi:hypothetical protein
MTDDDAGRQAARQLRGEYPKWLIIWVPRTGRYHAYRLAAANAGAGLNDTEPAGLAAQIRQAEHAAARQQAEHAVARQQARPRRGTAGGYPGGYPGGQAGL